MIKIKEENKELITAISIIIGTVVGVGFLGLPYTAAKAGFFVTAGYLLVFGSLILLINLYFGEVILRTRGEHHLIGFTQKYLGKTCKDIMFVLVTMAIFSALLAYMIGVGESLSFLFFGDLTYQIEFGALFGFAMSYLLWRGVKSLRKYEKIGVGALIVLLFLIAFLYSGKIDYSNLMTFNKSYFFLPLGVVLFSLIEFFSLPAVARVLKKNKKQTKKAIVIGTAIIIFIYLFFTLIVVGVAGENTPEVSTIAFGPLFIAIGIITMFTSYLALGTALERILMIDYRNKKRRAWFKTAIVPIVLFLILNFFEFLTFIDILSIGGVIAGGLIVIMVLAIHQKAITLGNRNPEYKISLNKLLAISISLIFILGIIIEIINLIN